jgi:hypothetical protein
MDPSATARPTSVHVDPVGRSKCPASPGPLKSDPPGHAHRPAAIAPSGTAGNHARSSSQRELSTVGLSSGCATSRKSLDLDPCGCGTAVLYPVAESGKGVMPAGGDVPSWASVQISMSCALVRASSSFGGDRRRSRSRPEAFGAGSDRLGVGRTAERRPGVAVCGAAWRCGAATRSSPKPAATPCSKKSAGQIERSSAGQTGPRVLALTCAKPAGMVIHSTSGAMVRDMGISVRSVQRIWVAQVLPPHRIRSFKRSNASEFAAKLEGIVAVYVPSTRTHSCSRSGRRSRFRCLTPASPACRASRVSASAET